MNQMQMEGQLAPVSSRMTIGDGVYLQLRNALITGSFDPGQILTIAALSKSFQTSHMPVREALRRLAAESALEVTSNGSAKVPDISVARLDDICQARIALEGLATQLAAEKGDVRGLKGLDELMARHDASSAAGNIYDMLLKNRDFHFAIYRASQSEVLVQLIDSLWLRYGPYMRMLSSFVAARHGTGLLDPFTSHHHQIVAAIMAGDGAAARGHIIADITGTRDLLRELCLKGEDGAGRST